MEENKRIPADIFAEMAGIEPAPTNVSDKNKENVNLPQQVTPINFTRLKAVAAEFNKLVIKDYSRDFLNIAKELLNLQKNQEIVKKPEKIIIQAERSIEEPEEEPEEKEESLFDKLLNLCIKYVPPPYKYIFVAIKYFKKFAGLLLSGAITLLGMLWKFGKTVLKLAFDALKGILKVAFKVLKIMLKYVASAITKFVKSAIKILVKAFRYIMRMFLKLVRTMWRIVKVLFFRGKKPSKPLFKNEPKPVDFKANDLRIKGGVTVKFKPLTQKEGFIMRLIKKALRPLQKFFWTVIKKVFGKLLKKLVTTVISIITGFVFGQILGSCIPLIGNAIGAIYGVANTLLKITSIGMTVYGIFKDVKDLTNDLADSSDDDDGGEDDEEEEDELTEEEMESSDFRKVLDKLEKEKQLNSPEYLRIKQKYLESLLEENIANGNKNIADLIQVKLNESKEKGIQSLDLKVLDKDIEKINLVQEAEAFDKTISKDSLTTLLNDNSKSNYVRWLELFNRAINLIRITLFKREEYTDYKGAIVSHVSKYFEPRNFLFKYTFDFFKQSDTENVKDISIYKIKKDISIDELASLYIEPQWEVFEHKDFEKYTLEKLANKFPEIKKEVVYFHKEATPFCDAKEKEISAQKMKYNIWLDILTVLDSDGIYKNKYQKQH